MGGWVNERVGGRVGRWVLPLPHPLTPSFTPSTHCHSLTPNSLLSHFLTHPLTPQSTDRPRHPPTISIATMARPCKILGDSDGLTAPMVLPGLIANGKMWNLNQSHSHVTHCVHPRWSYNKSCRGWLRLRSETLTFKLGLGFGIAVFHNAALTTHFGGALC